MESTHLPPLPEEIEEQYLQLISDIGDAMAEVVSALPTGLLKCQPGCDECCVSFSVFALEAAFISKKIHTTAVFRKERNKEDNCPLLCDKQCPIYEYRPVLCRTQGAPIGYINIDTGMVEVSACPLNFSDDFQFSKEMVLFMDEFNGRLSALNELYCRQAGLDPHKRIILSDLIHIG